MYVCGQSYVMTTLLCHVDSRTKTQLSGLVGVCLTAGLAAVCLTAEPSQQPIFYKIRKKENHLWTPIRCRLTGIAHLPLNGMLTEPRQDEQCVRLDLQSNGLFLFIMFACNIFKDSWHEKIEKPNY